MSKPSLNYYQSVHVGKVKTDVIQFTTIQAAINAITDNADGKRYAVYVHPGSYAEQIVMEDYIDLIAVGGREETIITHTCTADDQITVTGENSMIKGFTIISIGNVGGPFRTRCVSNAVVGFEIEDCVLTATGPAAAAVTFNATASCDIRDCVVDSTGAAATGALFTTGGQTYNVYGTIFDAATDAIQVTTTPTLNLTDCTVSDNLNQDGGTVTVVRCHLEALDCDTATCTFTAELSRFTASITTAGAFAHNLTLRLCDLTGQGVASAATLATTMQMESCSHVGAVSNAGTGAFSIGNSDVTSVSQTDATGSITIYGGFVGSCLTATGSVVWWLNDDEAKVIATMSIAHALAAAGVNTIHIGPGTFAPAATLTMIAGVHLVGDSTPEQCVIRANLAAAIVTSAVDCVLENLTIENTNVGGPALTVSANTTRLHNCVVVNSVALADAVTMTGGNLYMYECFVQAGDIDLSTAACALGLYGSRLGTDPIDTAGVGLGHTLTFVNCDFNNQNVASTDTGATTMSMRGCSNVGQVANAGTGAFSIRDSDVGDVTTTSTGDITLYGGDLGTCTAASALGAIVWWKDTDLIYVIPAMLITHAVAAALTGDTIMLGQGVWTDDSLSPATGVDIVGQGKEISIIDASDAANPVFAIGDNISITIRGITIDNDAAGGAIRISPVGNNSSLVLEDCDVINAGVSDCVVVSIGGAGNGTLTARRTDFTSDNASSIVVLTRTAGAGLLYFNSWDCNFTTSGGATNAAIEVSAAVVADVNVFRATFNSCTLAIYSTGANHTIDIEEAEFATAGVQLAANAPTTNLTKCNQIGTFTENTTGTLTIKFCYLSGTFTRSAIGTTTMYRTHFGNTITNSAGNLGLQECSGMDVINTSVSTVTIEGGNWDTVTQGVSAGIVNIYGAVIATKIDCTVAGGTVNAYNCQVANITCTNATAAVKLYGGQLTSVQTATGIITWKVDTHTWRVIASTENMKVQDAIDAANAGDTIRIGPGTFTEALTCDAAADVVTLIGEGRDKTIITQAAGNTLTVTNFGTVCVENLTIQVTAGAGHNGILVDAAATNAGVALRGVKIDVTGTLATTNNGISLVRTAAAASLDAFDVEITATNVQAGASTTVGANVTGQGTVTLRECTFNVTDTNGTAYSVYIDQTTTNTFNCRYAAGIIYITAVATSIGVSHDDIFDNGVAPVTFAGAIGEFADLTGSKLLTCAGGVLIGEAVYISGANTVVEADNTAAAPIPAEGIVVYKPGGAGGLTCYVKNSGHIYMATPPAVWAAGTNVWLGVAGAQLVARPSDALKQVLGVGVDTKRMLINVSNVEVVTKVATVPVWPGAGTAPTGTHVNVNSRKAVAIVGAAGQTVFSHAWEVPEEFLALSALKVIVFPTGTGTFDWTAYSSKAATGELENNGSQTATADGVGVTDNTILDHDITAATAGLGLAEGDHFNCDMVVDAMGGATTQILVLGFRVEYSAQRGA